MMHKLYSDILRAQKEVNNALTNDGLSKLRNNVNRSAKQEKAFIELLKVRKPLERISNNLENIRVDLFTTFFNPMP